MSSGVELALRCVGALVAVVGGAVLLLAAFLPVIRWASEDVERAESERRK